MMRSLMRGLWWNRHVRRWVVAAIFLAQAAGTAIKAYEPELMVVYTHKDDTGFCEWRADNQLQITDQAWPVTRFLYDPQTEQLKSQGGLPSRYSLITPISYVFPPRFEEAGMPDTPLSTSPDGRYMVYPLQQERTPYPTPSYDMPRAYMPLVLVDRKTATSMIIRELHPSPYTFVIQWNLSGNAFVVIEQAEYGGDPHMFYVHGFDGELDAVQVKQISGYNEVAFDWSLEQVFDIDSTGRYLLAAGYFSREERRSHEMRLLLIDMHELSHTVVAQDVFFGAARFEQHGDQRIFYLSKTGLFAYDRRAGTNELLSAEINNLDIFFLDISDNGCRPAISPDGQFFAFDRDDGYAEVYVWPIVKP
jgi:hypothetical protein